MVCMLRIKEHNPKRRYNVNGTGLKGIDEPPAAPQAEVEEAR